jgi:hypothetical protein
MSLAYKENRRKGDVVTYAAWQVAADDKLTELDCHEKIVPSHDRPHRRPDIFCGSRGRFCGCSEATGFQEAIMEKAPCSEKEGVTGGKKDRRVAEI